MTRFYYPVEIEVCMLREDLVFLMLCARMHYDSLCKGTAEVGGFLYGWMNRLADDASMKVFVTYFQLDVIMKILELCPAPHPVWVQESFIALRAEHARVNARSEELL